METRKRSILKSLTWRAGGLVLTVGTAWLITRRVDVAASIGLVDTAVKLLAFYGHERLWLRIPFGRPRPSEYEI